MRYLDFVEGKAAVGGTVKIDVQDINGVGILRIGHHVHVVPRALQEPVIAVDELPFLAAIIGTVKAAILGLDQRPDAIRVGRDRHADLSVRPFGQAFVLYPFPRCAAVLRAIETAARAPTR